VARSVPVERSGTSTRRDAGSHSVDRIVRLFFFIPDVVIICPILHSLGSRCKQ
jgi:hypothetical protein